MNPDRESQIQARKPPIGPDRQGPVKPWRRSAHRRGDAMVWACGAATSALALMFVALIGVVAFHGLRAFWVRDVASLSLKGGALRYGAVTARDQAERRWQLYVGNRDLHGLDYVWVSLDDVVAVDYDRDVVVVERREKGGFIGKLEAVDAGDRGGLTVGGEVWTAMRRELTALEAGRANLERLERQLGKIHRDMERLRLKRLKRKNRDPARAAELEALRRQELRRFETLSAQLEAMRQRLRSRSLLMRSDGGEQTRIALLDIVRAYRPNRMSALDKTGLYLSKFVELMTAEPRESNTEGGLFPAIFGTIIMVFLMSVVCAPLGVIAAVYLREYAREGFWLRLTRIAVNNLAGVPSIVYGIFGLGFFVYGVGGSIDQLFFAERLPTPTFGAGGLLWASLTMALLTVPVVIVSTEEGLDSAPQNLREGSLALGATKFQSLTRVVLPMAAPGMLTGLILAIARAAGEVAPLMLVGVVKIAPSLPVDGSFPYVHLERKFMHLGFHIFDVGFQSPNAEAAKPMVYVTTLLLLFLVLGMSFLAMRLRDLMKKRYTMGAF